MNIMYVNSTYVVLHVKRLILKNPSALNIWTFMNIHKEHLNIH